MTDNDYGKRVDSFHYLVNPHVLVSGKRLPMCLCPSHLRGGIHCHISAMTFSDAFKQQQPQEQK